MRWWFIGVACLALTALAFLWRPEPPVLPPLPTNTDALPELTYEKPPIAADRIYRIEEIRWCLREDMILDEIRQTVSSRPQADGYNDRAESYNNRCATFRYRQDNLKRAQRQIETRRDEIIAPYAQDKPVAALAADRPAAAASDLNTAVDAFHTHGRHDYNASALCRTDTRPIAEKRPQSIYRWVDEKGVTHYSQQGGDKAEYIGDRYQTQERLFDLTVAFSDDRNDPVTRDSIHQNAWHVYDTMKGLIDRTHWRRVSLDILLYEKRADFQARLRQEGLGQWTGAFFSGRDNRMYMLYTPDNRERMLRIARHEVTHALMAGMVGPTPSWLNEGLAEYMELGAYDNTADPAANLRGTDDIQHLLSLSRDQFYGSDRERNYRKAYVLVRHLMSRSQGKQVLGRFLNDMAATPCRKIDSATVMTSAHPGGLTQLAREMGLPGPHG